MHLSKSDREAIEMGMTHHIKVQHGGIGCYVSGWDGVVNAISTYGGACPVVITPIAEIARLKDRINDIGK